MKTCPPSVKNQTDCGNWTVGDKFWLRDNKSYPGIYVICSICKDDRIWAYFIENNEYLHSDIEDMEHATKLHISLKGISC